MRVLPPQAEEHLMPRYFFHAFDGYSTRDAEGTELPDTYAAQHMAIHTSGEMLRDMGSRFWDGTGWKLEVTDDQGHVLFTLRFSAEERIAPTGQPPDPGSS
jgi:hypothetical protein